MQQLDRTSFQDRLRRIEAQPTGPATASTGARSAAPQQGMPPGWTAQSQHGGLTRVLGGLITFAVLGVGAYLGLSNLDRLTPNMPGTAATGAAGSLQFADPAPPPAIRRPDQVSDGPSDGLTVTVLGPAFSPAHVLTQGHGAVPLERVARSVPAPAAGRAPNVTALRPVTNCGLTAPAPGAKLVDIRIDQSPAPGPVHSLSQADMISALISVLTYKAPPTPERLAELNRVGDTRSVALYLTDTIAPLHLLLQSASPGTIWEVHIAPGVEISHVALIAPGISGVAGLPAATRVTALDLTRGDATAPNCPGFPARRPDSLWGLTEAASTGDIAAQTEIPHHRRMARRYDQWLSAALGGHSLPTPLGAVSAAHVLIGPPPAAPFLRAPGWTMPLRMIAPDEVLVGPPEQRAATLTARRDLLMQEALIIPPDRFRPTRFQRSTR